MCVGVGFFLPAQVKRQEQVLVFAKWDPHTLWCPTVQVKGPAVFRHEKVLHNVISVSAETELETRLTPLFGSPLKTPIQTCLFAALAKSSLFSSSQHFHASKELLTEQLVLLDPGTAPPAPLCTACHRDTYLCSSSSLLAVYSPDTDLIKPLCCSFTPALKARGWAC